jgi:hypothetical protein
MLLNRESGTNGSTLLVEQFYSTCPFGMIYYEMIVKSYYYYLHVCSNMINSLDHENIE